MSGEDADMKTEQTEATTLENDVKAMERVLVMELCGDGPDTLRRNDADIRF